VVKTVTAARPSFAEIGGDTLYVYQRRERMLKQFLPHERTPSANLPLVARHKLAVLVLTALIGVGFGGCYRGFDVEDKQPPPGYPGGACLLDGCYQPATCLADEDVCIDPNEPCKGIYCSGNGTCGIDMATDRPFCSCDPGFTDEPYAYFCIPMGL